MGGVQRRMNGGKHEPYDATKPFNEHIRELIRATHPDGGPLAVVPEGKRFRVELHPSFVAAHYGARYPDGMGTKGKLHWEMDTLENGARDALAMVFDDAIESGRVPIELVDHLMVQEEDEGRIFRIIKKLSDLCIEHQWPVSNGTTYPVAITAGETAILDTIQGFELGVTAIAYAMKGHVITPIIRPGDAVIGIASSGVHSNGITFLREAFEGRRMDLDHQLPWGTSVGRELTVPTNIYLPAIRALIDEFREGDIPANRFITGMVHITGGGFYKLKKELIGDRRDIDIEITRAHGLDPQEIFKFAQREFKVTSGNMYMRFNNGIGYVVVVSGHREGDALEVLNRHFKAETIGRVVEGIGKVRIESKYESNNVVYSAR
ncbi:MAG: hypothetical protein KGH72_02320 [Candidatus Micrarchaeota archaeon]|nr:hypothetical protein [Candidatus Micrarchaeota archaeon]